MVLVMLGGALGCYLRYLISKWCGERPFGQVFPWGTMIVNTVGCFILAVTAVVCLERTPHAHPNWYLLLGTGFCGGFTTFSTFSWETYTLVREGSLGMAFANLMLSCLAGFVGILLAVALVDFFMPKR